MAQATVATRQERKVVQQFIEVETVALELSRKEADFLYFILGYIGGSPTKSPRKYAADIKEALSSVRPPFGYNPFSTSMLQSREGTALMFKDDAEYNYGTTLKDD